MFELLLKSVSWVLIEDFESVIINEIILSFFVSTSFWLFLDFSISCNTELVVRTWEIVHIFLGSGTSYAAWELS